MIPNAFSLELLTHDTGRYGPIFIKVNSESCSATCRLCRIKVFFDVVCIINCLVSCQRHKIGIPSRLPSIADTRQVKSVGARNVINKPCFVFAIADEANSRRVTNGDIYKALKDITCIAFGNRIKLDIVASREHTRRGLVGDEPNATCL